MFSREHSGHSQTVCLCISAHNIHVLDGLTSRTFYKVVNCRDRNKPRTVSLKLEVDITEVGSANSSQLCSLETDKRLILVEGLIPSFYLLQTNRLVKEDMCRGNNSPDCRKQMGMESGLCRRTQLGGFRFHCGKMGVGRNFLRGNGLIYVRVVGCL